MMAGAPRLLFLLLLGGALQDLRCEGQHNTRDPDSDNVEANLLVTFISSQDSGLLFFAAGASQYLLLELSNGTIRARLERGEGESILYSPTWMVLKKKEMYRVNLIISQSQMSLTLNNFTSIMDLPWSPQKLLLDDDIFLGGIDESKVSHQLRNIPVFHGCILEAKLDDMDLLSSSISQVELHGQWEDCQINSMSNSADSFGFLGPRSFIILPNWDISSQGSISFTLETSRPGRAPIIYLSGPRKSYIYFEIAGGHLQGTLDTGTAAVKIQNVAYVSDGQPHDVQLFIEKSKMQLTVDTTSTHVSLDNIGPNWDFHGNLYLGGVDEMTLNTIRKGPLSPLFIDDMEYKSFSGCITDLKINSIGKGMQDVLTSRDVTDGCHDYEYVDYEEVTTHIPFTTTPAGSVVIKSLSDFCKLGTGNSKVIPLLNPKPLSVTRGSFAVLEWRHIYPKIDLSKVGLRQSQIVFAIINETENGHLELDIPGAETRRKFTLLDVTNRKVKYVHDGSQSHEDHLTVEMSLASGVNVPECLRKAQTYNLKINISPSTEVPVIEFPKGNIIGILKGGRQVLTGDILKIKDTDTPCDLLNIYVTVDFNKGNLEFQNEPGNAIDEFSCNDLQDGQVVFVHKSGKEVQLTLQASDGTSRSSLVHVNFIVLELQKNTTQKAIVISERSYAPITSSNVPVVINSDKLGIEIIYHVAQNPRLGVVQKIMPGAEWKTTGAFTQSDLESAKVRYLSTVSDFSGDEIREELKIQLEVGRQIIGNSTLRVKVKRSSVQMLRMVPLKLGKKRETNLSDKHLQVDTIMQGRELALFTYFIIQSPKKGNLLFDRQRLIEGSRFTQEDLVNERISYVATVRNTKDTEDQFQFQVLYGSRTSAVYTYKILIGADPDAPQLTIRLLHVLEGGQEAIRPDHLFLKSGSSDGFLYEIIDGPQHGMLLRKGRPESGDPTEEGISEFTNDDISEGLLFYQHDGSETTEDDIPFVASRQQEGSASDMSGEGEYEEQEVVRGVFRVSIQPVNDNPPVQTVNKVFNVVRDGQKLLTTNDIAFLDPDSGSTDSQIVLIRYGVSFGKFVFVDDPSLEVVRFTQEDLRKLRVLFIHSGPDQGSVQLSVSDGLHHLTAILEVQASDPYIHISNITTINVLPGEKATLSATSLKLETNLDLRTEEEIKYYISTKPRWGEVLKEGQPSESFSQQDLADGLVVFQHSGEGSNRDHFRISVEANQVVAVGDIKVQVMSDSPPVTLNVIHNEKVYVFQGEAAEIKKEFLMVSAEGMFPHKIAYSLVDPPSFGYLVSISGELSSDGSPSLDSVQTFTQEDINKGKILYLHSASETVPDRMTLEVSAGDTAQEVVIPLEILSTYIPVEAGEMVVKEGGTAPLSSSIIHIPSDYYLSLHLEFTLLDAPMNGRITDKEGQDLKTFNWNELDQGRVSYEHNGSETKNDSFTVIVNASDVNHQSLPITINVTVQPVNDEKPHVVINTGMKILEGETEIISADNLQSIDDDSASEEVVYTFLPPSNGELIVRGFPGRVLSFTQKDLDDGMVQFMHTGELNGGFFFKVSDGENESEEHFFQIQASPITVHMEKLQGLIACPRSLNQITSQHLKAVTNEKTGTQPALLYHIEDAPQIGNIFHQKNLEGPPVSNFSQADVDEGLIYYQHVSGPSPFWTTEDHFSFHVQSPRAVSQQFIQNVTVTFQGSCPQLHTQLWKNTGLEIIQGGSSPIKSESLDASNLLANASFSRLSHDVVFQVTSFPLEGHLSLQGTILNAQTPYFLQSHLENGSLVYTNTKLGSRHDNFQFRAQLQPRSQAYDDLDQKESVWTVPEYFNITINYIPLVPPIIRPPKSKIILTAGSNVSLTSDHISVDSILVPPEKIIYSIQEAPVGVIIVPRVRELLPVLQFTQEELDRAALFILANLTAVSGDIIFNITAGPQSLVEKLPVKVVSVHQSILEVKQASGRSTITLAQMPQALDNMSQTFSYIITSKPSYGQILVGQVPVSEFQWEQVNQNEVFYAFTSFISTQDQFEYLAFSDQGEEAIGKVTVDVSPMVKVGSRQQWPRGCTIQLGLDVLDAGELSTNTKSIPQFTVLQHPRGGKVVRFPDKDGRGEGTSTNMFTQQELENGLVGVEVWEDDQGRTDIKNDRLHLVVSATKVPPANVTLRFSTVPYNSSHTYSAILLKKAGASETTTDLKVSTTTLVPTSMLTTYKSSPSSGTTIYSGSMTSESTTPLETTATTTTETTTTFIATTDLATTKNTEPKETSVMITSTLETSTYLETSRNSTYYIITGDFGVSEEDLYKSTTEDMFLNLTSLNVSMVPALAGEDTRRGFLDEHLYSIILPICILLLLILIGLLLLAYFVRRKKMGKHHVQKVASSAAKTENGARERQTFRPTEPDRGIPLSEVGGHKGNGIGGNGQPGSQYWV
ncbi:chondroitin sulfate proteoglycan 4 [Gastrophryne carolinensis]